MVALYVEDDDPTFFLVQTAVAEAQLPVKLFRAADGDDALSFLGHKGAYSTAPSPELVLLDLNLPRVSGFDVLKKAKKDEMAPNVPFLVLTTSSAEKDRDKSFELGAQGFYTKPSSYDELIELMRSIFNREWNAASAQ